MPDTDCDTERVPHGDAVKETDTVPHELDEGECDIVDEPDGLNVPLLQLDTEELYDDDTVGDDDNVVEIVDDGESVPEPDCDRVSVPHGDAV